MMKFEARPNQALRALTPAGKPVVLRDKEERRDATCASK